MDLDIRHIPMNPALTGLAEVTLDIAYSNAAGVDVKLALLTPWGAVERGDKLPLIVFVQGSAWTFPNIGYELPQLSRYAQEGYAVATLTHRNCLEGHPFPAYLQDVKTAIRFLRAHAEQYAIDPERVCIFGTSSGGNTALLVALTGDDPAFKTDEYAGESDRVQLMVECFGPTDLAAMVPADAQDESFAEIFRGLAGDRPLPEVLHAMSPVNRVAAGGKYPPMLLIHGDADELVPYDQMTRMYKVLLENGVDARAICVDGAPHEGSFWSRELHDIILEFIRERL
jgi:acetyl esterase/lipase